MSSGLLRVGMVGVRHYAEVRRLQMKETGLFELVAVYNRSREPALALEQAEGVKAVFRYEDLLDVPGLEAIVISGGASDHARQTLMALERGYHVFVEKPLCSTPAEMRALLAAARARNLVVGVGHTDHDNDPVAQTIRRLIREGRFGTVAAVEATTAHSGGLVMSADDWRANRENNPGGMLFQCGVHKFHELMYYFGPIVEVQAMMRYDVHTSPTADVAICQIRFASGLIGTVHAYHVTPYRHTLSIFGTRANLYRNDRYFDEGSTLLIQEVPGNDFGAKMPMTAVTPEGPKDPCGSVRSFCNAIRRGGEPYPSIVDGARAVAVVFAAEESAETGRLVRVESV